MPTTTHEEAKDQKVHEPDEQARRRANDEERSPATPENKSPEPKPKDDEQKSDAETKPVNPATKRFRIILGVAIGIVLIAGGVVWWLYARTYESTDDAQIDGHLNSIASRVAGSVKTVFAENGQPVKAGQALVDLDPSDYEVQVAQARAAYEQALAQAAAESPNVPITQSSNRSTVDVDAAGVVNGEAAVASAQHDSESNAAKLHQAEANNRKSQSDLVRYKKLVDKGEISLSDYDQYIANAGSQEAAVEASRYAVASSGKIVEERRAQLLQQQSKLSEDKVNAPRQVAISRANVESRKASADSAKAQLDAALLNLSYCHIVAPVDGIASQRSAEVAGRISVGQQLIVLVQTANVWTTANFKETQLRKMHVGQRVTIKVDSLGESFEGQVENMPAATGDRSSLFPPENATGNYVKIVQRLPVRIRFHPNQRDLEKLRPGMSVSPKVHLD
jgi:membrane fusion protein (multidrug efflux system)